MNKSHPYQLILIDGSSYLYRAFHALPPLTNAAGKPTGAIYGVVSMIRKLLTDYPVDHIAVVFDAKGKTFREEIYTEYKANRSEMPLDLQAQIEPLDAVIRAMGLPLIRQVGVEADDIIGTLAQQATQMGIHTLISTVDKDLAQLVNSHVTLVNTMTNTFMDEAGVVAKFGIAPSLITDYLALTGDSIDNIPGVPSVGPKTAVKWLNQYGSLENIVKHADEIKGKVGECLRDALSFLPTSKQLVTMHEVTLNETPETLHRTEADVKTLFALYQELEFKRWLVELSPAETTEKKNYKTILTMSEFEAWFTRLEQADLIALQTFTKTHRYREETLVGLAFALSPGEAAYIPFAHDYISAPRQLDRSEILTKLKPFLENPSKFKVGHNLKFDQHILMNEGIVLKGAINDVMIASYVIDSSSSRHDLDNLSLKYLHQNKTSYEDVAGKGIKQLTINQLEIEKAAHYAAGNADIILQLHACFEEKLAKEPGLKRVLTEIEMPLLLVLTHMERRGVLIDAEKLHAQSHEIAEHLQSIETQSFEIAGQQFNLGSPKQLQEVLFEKQKLPILEKTPTGQPSTGESVLQELALDYPLPKLILTYRSLSKLKSTYTDTLPKQVNEKTGRIHTCYQQAVAATGRLASTDPNLQNIPIKTEEGRRVREAFISRQGYKIVSADYSQIELRIMAHISSDPNLIKAFQNGWDIHRATAAEVLGLPLESVTSEQRRSAKAVNFGLIYGMSSFGLAKQLNIPREAAQEYINLYFKRYPLVKAYIEQTCEKAKQQGYVETLYGRRLYLLDINAHNLQRQKAAERAAINAPMQGTAADIIKLAMISLDRYLQDSNLDADMIMQVHDELVFEVADKDVEQLVAVVREHMVHATELLVPIVVDIGVGDNWNMAH